MIIERESVVDAPAERVWARVVSPEGINDEMRPWMTMSIPRGLGPVTIDSVPIGVPLGRAWLRLFGVVPFDYDALTIAELEPGQRFHEKSTMLSMRRWEHERTVTSSGDARAVVHDRVTFESRLSILTPVLAVIVRSFFAHRHRRLARHFAA
ncbi:hypothetical protein [Prescottella agglutinans]|uniref:Ligand-binding SRPBCC domain-containing protein n=1 Tax=Prescottella agglutinans TaxID=1644129 RepID=A0ABT6ME16_9NOCA|nr:hypothetical protein [Prescottella agglutinans]MDH6282552.1 ligand-binding SRPBCC domain-containing protein [Prescottella agglutinans]